MSFAPTESFNAFEQTGATSATSILESTPGVAPGKQTLVERRYAMASAIAQHFARFGGPSGASARLDDEEDGDADAGGGEIDEAAAHPPAPAAAPAAEAADDPFAIHVSPAPGGAAPGTEAPAAAAPATASAADDADPDGNPAAPIAELPELAPSADPAATAPAASPAPAAPTAPAASPAPVAAPASPAPVAAPASPAPAPSARDEVDAVYDRIRHGGVSLFDMRREVERGCIARALDEAGGNITRAAALLGMKRPRLSQLVREYGLARGGEAGETPDP